MRNFLILLSLVFCQFLNAQSKGTLTGIITDKEANNGRIYFVQKKKKKTAIIIFYCVISFDKL